MTTHDMLARLRREKRTRIYLHIGAMKTGTTFLQELMSAHKDELAAQGILFPGRTWLEQDRAARDVLGFADGDARLSAQSKGKWQDLAQQMLGHRGEASVLSMEFLSFATEEQAARVVRSLDGADVHVVLTVRDAARTIPAQWQSMCRNGGRIPWRGFLRGVEESLVADAGFGRAARAFQRTQGIPRMLDAWVPLVGADRVHLVTVPPQGADPLELWWRFARVIGAPRDACTSAPDYSNGSLGYASSELLRLLNVRLGAVGRSDYDRVMKGPLARQVLARRAPDEAPVPMNRWAYRLAVAWNNRVLQAVAAQGVSLRGTKRDLLLEVPDHARPGRLTRPSDLELLDAARDARAGFLLQLGEGVPPSTMESPAAGRPGRELERALDGLVVLARACIDRLPAETPAPAHRSVEGIPSLRRTSA